MLQCQNPKLFASKQGLICVCFSSPPHSPPTQPTFYVAPMGKHFVQYIAPMHTVLQHDSGIQQHTSTADLYMIQQT
jgi:hypothetical protein